MSVFINQDDIMADIGQAGAGNETDIAGTDKGEVVGRVF